MTTKAQIQAGGGNFCVVVAIEGYDKLLTDWHDTDAVGAAWDGTDWDDNTPIGLVTNGDAESSLVGGEIPGWTEETGTWSYSSSSIDPSNKFTPGNHSYAELIQDIDVSAYATHIDAGVAEFAFSGYGKTYAQTPADQYRLHVEYRDADGDVLDEYDTGNQTNTSWTQHTDTRDAPAGTRTIRIRLRSTRNSGSQNDAVYDLISLIYKPTASVLTGLEFRGEFTQEAEPMNPSLDWGSLTFAVYPDGTDTFARDTWSSHKTTGKTAKLQDEADRDDLAFVWTDSSDLPANGDLWVGPECTPYTSNDGTTTTGHSRGRYCPFETDGGDGFTRHHRTRYQKGKITYPKYGTDWKRNWIGSYVAVYIHRVTGGVLDTKANAHLLFAGTIAGISQTDDENGSATVVTCDDIRKQIADHTVLEDAYVGDINSEGIYLDSTNWLAITELDEGVSGNVAEWYYASDLGAPGVFTAQELVDKINELIESDAPDLNGEWTFKLRNYHTEIKAKLSSAVSQRKAIRFTYTYRIGKLLGFQTDTPVVPGDSSNTRYFSMESEKSEYTSATVVSMVSPNPYTYADFAVGKGQGITIVNAEGVWIDQTDQMPQFLRAHYDMSSGNWGFLRLDDNVFLAHKTGTDTFQIYYAAYIHDLFGITKAKRRTSRQFEGANVQTEVPASNKIPQWKQVLLLEGTFEAVLTRLLASTGTDGYNHATYDEYAYQVGVGIPWSLLGDDFVESARDIGEVNPNIRVLVTEPTELNDIILSELALRNAHLSLYDGKLVLRRPTAAFTDEFAADHTLTDDDMVADPDNAHRARPTSEYTDEYIYNVIKVKYDRDLDGKFLHTLSTENEISIADYGPKTITIEGRNWIVGESGFASDIEDLKLQLDSEILANYDVPLQKVKMPISLAKAIDMVPGDGVNFSNSFVRYTGDGSLGVTNVAAYVVSVTLDFDRWIGDVTLLLTGEELARAAQFSPAGLIDQSYSSGNFSGGYSATDNQIKLVAHEFSDSDESNDADHFEVGDYIKIARKSPPTPASPQQWSTQVTDTPATNILEIDTTLTGFAPSVEYYVISDSHSTAASSQQSDAYLADDADDKIVDSERSRTFRNFRTGATWQAWGDTDVRHEYPPLDGTWYDEGKPIHPAMYQALAKSATNFVSRKSAIQIPNAWTTATTAGVGTYWYTFAAPIYIKLPASNLRRYFHIGPRFYTDPGTMELRVSSSERRPMPNNVFTESDLIFDGPRRYVTFSTTSTTGENVAAEALELVLDRHGGTWLTLQAKHSSGGYLTLQNFHTWWLGELRWL